MRYIICLGFIGTAGDVILLGVLWALLKEPKAEVGKANAHIIAAAPEMYDALKLAERTLSQGPNSDGLDEVRDAIYKAEGRTAVKEESSL